MSTVFETEEYVEFLAKRLMHYGVPAGKAEEAAKDICYITTMADAGIPVDCLTPPITPPVQAPKSSDATGKPVIGPDDPLPFGKHRGQTLRNIQRHDPSYLRWAFESVTTVVFSEDARKLAGR